MLFEPCHEKTNVLGFRSGLTQTTLYSHRRWLEAANFGCRNFSCRKKRYCTIQVAKNKGADQLLWSWSVPLFIRICKTLVFSWCCSFYQVECWHLPPSYIRRLQCHKHEKSLFYICYKRGLRLSIYVFFPLAFHPYWRMMGKHTLKNKVA